MARTGALPRKSLATARARALVLIAPLAVLEVTSLSGPPDRAGRFALGIALWIGAAILCTALTLALGVALGARVMWLSIGIGPRLSRRVIGDHVRVVRALPIAVGGGVLPRKNAARVWRIFTGSLLLLPVLLVAAAAPLVPGWSALTMAVMTAAVLIVTATNRDPASGRLIASRVLIAPGKHTDPALARPDRVDAGQALVDVQFGDFTRAEAVLARLRAEPDAALSVALLSTELLAARGQYDAALRVPFPPPDPADAAALTEAQRARESARAAKLMLLAAEQDPRLQAKAQSMAPSHLRSVAASGTGALMDRTGGVLLALMRGDPRIASRMNRVCLARARTPLALAEALCTQARVEAAAGNVKKAARHLDEAARLAPWYPRVTTVRQIVGAEAAATARQPLPSTAGTATAHVFEEPWSVSAPASEES